MKCKTILKILILKFLEQKITDYLYNHHALIVKIKSRFVKKQDAKGLLSNLGINTPFSKIPLLNALF